jgi:hypothetical protein
MDTEEKTTANPEEHSGYGRDLVSILTANRPPRTFDEVEDVSFYLDQLIDFSQHINFQLSMSDCHYFLDETDEDCISRILCELGRIQSILLSNLRDWMEENRPIVQKQSHAA